MWLACTLICLTGERPTAYAGMDDLQIRKAQEMLSRGWYLQAMGRFKELAAGSRDRNVRAKALFFVAQIYSLYLEQKQEAMDRYDSIMREYPDSPSAPDALFNKGILFFDQGEYRKAHNVFNRYVKQYPDSMRCDSARVWADIAKPLFAAPPKPPPPPPAKKAPQPPPQNDLIRVLLRRDAGKVVLRSQEAMDVTSSGRAGKPIYSGWGPLTFTRKGGILTMNGRRLGVNQCRVSSDAAAMWLDGRLYRGRFVIGAGDSGLMVVNHVPLEKYLYGVIPEEMPDSWEEHALMAQAVAARTYALYSRNQCTGKPWDLEATTASQVYGGYSAETTRCTRAVDATRQQVMTHNGNLIVACFHSSSGGYTADPQFVWNTEIPYLRAIPDRFSPGSEIDGWEYYLSFEHARRKLNEYGLSIRNVRELRARGKSRSGRTLEVLVISEKGVFPFSSNLFRSAIGETKIKSTLFQIAPWSRGFLIKGRGYGHGVGMSQHSANRMAKAGSSYLDILRYYYQGIKVVRLNGPGQAKSPNRTGAAASVSLKTVAEGGRES